MTTANQTDAQMKLAREYAIKVTHFVRFEDEVLSFWTVGWSDKAKAIYEAATIQSALLAIQETETRAQGLVDALTASALRFREYEASHAAKGNLDGDAKARRNCEMAEQCEQALATWRRT